MKRIVILLLMASLVCSAEAKKKKEETPNPDPKTWITKLKWSNPEKTDIASVNSFYAQGDTIYKHLNDLASDMTFYDVKKIVNTTTGDTLVAVVDDQGNIRGSKAAFNQYVQAGKIAFTIGQDIISGLTRAKAIKKDWNSLVKGDILKNISQGVGLGKAIKEMTVMQYVVSRDLIKGFATQKGKIEALINHRGSPYDPSLVNLPELSSDDDVLAKSDQEILDGLETAQKEDESFVSEHGSSIFDRPDDN